MSLPQTDDQAHNCATCGKEFPCCGVKRRQKEGYCTRWQPKGQTSIGVKT